MLKLGTIMLAVALIAAACSGPEPDAASDTAPSASTSTSTTAVPSVRPATEESPPPAHDHVTSAPTPLGPLPSFNESGGCGRPQGVRGPDVAEAGFVGDDIEIGGPWGDFFGRDLAEVRGHLVPMELPNGDGLRVTVHVHERVVPALEAVISNLEREAANGNVYPIDRRYVSTHRAATIPPRRYLSFHAVGMAIDINTIANPYSEDNVLTTDMPDWFVAAWTDAGWCWGGDWVRIKDPMHFSWMGPRHTPGYASRPPMPIRTPSASFERSLHIETGLGPAPEGAVHLVADVDRDGAPDVVRATRSPLGYEVVAAAAVHSFDTCRPLGTTPHADRAAALAMFDRTGDGRPDLWEIDPSGDAVAVYTRDSRLREHLPVIPTAGRPAPGATFLVADHDGDGNGDLHVVSPGVPASLEVWEGPGMTERLLAVSLPLSADASWRFALGERDGDGVPDLFAVGSGGLVVIVPGADSFGAVGERLVTAIGDTAGDLSVVDFDGDGRGDIYIIDTDGSFSVFLGGVRTDRTDLDLTTWFLGGADRQWEYRSGCPGRETLPR